MLIKPSEPKSTSRIIKPTHIEDEKNISFNFQFLDSTNKKFCFDQRDSNYFQKLIDQLKNLSNLKRSELNRNHQLKKQFRYHEIDFKSKNTSENSFDMKNKDLCQDAWQFQLTSNEHGRVHGFYVGSIFFIRWLDPNHALYPAT